MTTKNKERIILMIVFVLIFLIGFAVVELWFEFLKIK